MIIVIFATFLLSCSSQILRSDFPQYNILGDELEKCNKQLKTGIHHNGFCEITSRVDTDLQTICAIASEEYLNYAKSQKLDMSIRHHYFNRVKPGTRFCLEADLWMQAMAAGVAPKVVARATNSKSMWRVSLSDLKEYESVSDDEDL